LICINDPFDERRSIHFVSSLCRAPAMSFRISGNFGDRKAYLRLGPATAGHAHVEAVVDDAHIDREHASRILRMMADRLLESDWPPDMTSESDLMADRPPVSRLSPDRAA
jgi:polyisoprenoid-binding protein YceI